MDPKPVVVPAQPLLFGKRRPVSDHHVAQYAGTDTEVEPVK